MPSIVVSNLAQSPENSKRKSKEKKMKAKVQLEANGGFESPALDKKHKKEKKSSSKGSESKQPKLLEHRGDVKKEKKRKALELREDDKEDKSETSSELVDPENLKGKKKKKKTRLSDGDDEVAQEENPTVVSNFRISDSLRLKLKDNGIDALFPIQTMRFDIVLDGTDLVCCKTLAFVLPISESSTNGPTKTSRKIGCGRPPSVLVLLPTRELVKQVFSDFEVYGGVVGLTSCCLYGGVPSQVKNDIERENIDLSSLTFRVLHEADEMLRIGFVEDVELILGKVKDTNKVQTLLFSISSRFLKLNKRTIDLVGKEKMKASANVRHIVIPCTSSARPQLIPNIYAVTVSYGGRTIIFTETKESASQLSGLLPGARPLHGDIQQAQRKVTLTGFRSGKFMILVATNVCRPPRDVEAYIHRSRRIGRAGQMYLRSKESGVKFEHIAAPQPRDVAQAVGVEAAESIRQIFDSVIPAFKSVAEQLLNTSGMSVVELLAKALAKASGYSEIKSRSLLSSLENHVTLLLETGRPIYTPSYAFGVLRRFLPEDKVEFVKEGEDLAVGGGRGGYGGRGDGFSWGRGGSFSGQRNGGFSGGFGGGRARGNNRR
ncbi:hypothetical protein ACJRO7_000614 [Eucalyptus globulus]|uniref:RNA helicase n=1 Tax=Eucalyptus globulus TaxID=34317 RepID=A0ABD3LTX9_EUCGL